MAHLFKKIKGSFASLNKLRSKRQPNPLIPNGPEPAANALVSLDQPVTPLTPVSSPVIMKKASRVKISRIKRGARRPQSVIRERGGDDVDDKENITSRRVYEVSQKPISQKRKRKLGVVKPKFRIAS